MIYLATVLDCCTRKVVGYVVAVHMRAWLVCEAIGMAVRRFRSRTVPYHEHRRTPPAHRRRTSGVPLKERPQVWDHLSAPRTFDELCQRTGMTRARTRYALNSLIAADMVEMVGGQGHRETTYRRTRRTP